MKLSTAILALLSVVRGSYWETFEGGPTYEIVWDTNKNMFKFIVKVPPQTDLWLGYSDIGDKI